MVYFINYKEDTDIQNISNIIWKWVDSCHPYLRNTASFLILLLLHILIYKSWNIFTCDFLFCIIIIDTAKLVFQLHLKCGHFIKVHGTPWKVAVMVSEHSFMCNASFWANFLMDFFSAVKTGNVKFSNVKNYNFWNVVFSYHQCVLPGIGYN